MRIKSDLTPEVSGQTAAFRVPTKADPAFETIGMVGLGHVGLTLGLALADVGFPVQGTDVNPKVLDIIRAMRSHFKEKGLSDLLHKHIGKKLQVLDMLMQKVGKSLFFEM